MPDGAFLREAYWHSAGLAFLPQAVPQSGTWPRAKAAGEAHAYARYVVGSVMCRVFAVSVVAV